MQAYDYDVFFSHSSQDKSDVELLFLYLQEHQFKIWLSYPEIEGGDEWLTELEKGLRNSAILLVYWTKYASESKWVANEILEMRKQNKPVLPLLIDNTPLPFHLNDVQYLDFRSASHAPYTSLVSRLHSLLETASEKHLVLDSDLAWKPIRNVSPRNRFLAEQNYIDDKAETFATNNWTKELFIDTEFSRDRRFVTYVAVPFPTESSVDLETLYEIIWSHPQQSGQSKLGNVDPGLPWRWFDTRQFTGTRKTKHELILIDNQSQRHNGEGIFKFARFTDSGAIEFALSYPAVHPKALFNFSIVLGCAWKFVNFAAYLYTQLGYKGVFQFLVNLCQTHTTILANFANDLVDPLSREAANADYLRKNYAAIDEHLQFAFEIDASGLFTKPELSKDIMKKLGRDVGRSFNYAGEELSLFQQIDNFDWKKRFFEYDVGV